MSRIEEAKFILENLQSDTETHISLIEILKHYITLAEKEEFRKDYKIVSIQYERR